MKTIFRTFNFLQIWCLKHWRFSPKLYPKPRSVTSAIVCQLADPVQDKIHNLFSDGVVPASEIVSSVFFSRLKPLLMQDPKITTPRSPSHSNRSLPPTWGRERPNLRTNSCHVMQNSFIISTIGRVGRPCKTTLHSVLRFRGAPPGKGRTRPDQMMPIRKHIGIFTQITSTGRGINCSGWNSCRYVPVRTSSTTWFQEPTEYRSLSFNANMENKPGGVTVDPETEKKP